MKIRGNESDAEVSFLASYFLYALPIAKVIAQKVDKNPKITFKNLTYASPFIIIIYFTTDN